MTQDPAGAARFNSEAQPSGQDLNHGSAACLMLAEPLAGVEAEHRDVHPVASVYDPGDNRTGLDDHFAGEIGDQRMRHTGIIVPPTPTVNVPRDARLPLAAIFRPRSPSPARRQILPRIGATTGSNGTPGQVRLARVIS